MNYKKLMSLIESGKQRVVGGIYECTGMSVHSIGYIGDDGNTWVGNPNTFVQLIPDNTLNRKLYPNYAKWQEYLIPRNLDDKIKAINEL